MKIKCIKCKKEKNNSDFCKDKSRKNRFYSYCKECCRNKRNYKEENDKRRESLLDRIYAHYGQKCACCGELNVKFLTIDHISNDGYPWSKTGKQRISHIEMMGKIIKEGYSDKYQILCYNCNNGKRINNGICPHSDTIKAYK